MRLFVATEVPPSVAGAVARAVEGLKRGFRSVRWEDPAKYHFTLKFLGEVGAERLPDVTAAVARSSLRVEPFDVRLRGFGSVPPGRSPRVVWAGVGSGGVELGRLAEALEGEFRALGFPREARPYSAHLTVGRVRGPGEGPALAQALGKRATAELGEAFRTERLLLLESRLLPGGSRYESLHASALGAAGGGG